MKKLEKLKLHNLEEICVKEQQSMLGGSGSYLYWSQETGWTNMLDEVVVSSPSAWYGNYLGPGSDGDPRACGIAPINQLDSACFNHDLGYYIMDTGGVSGALFNLNVSPWDTYLSFEAFESACNSDNDWVQRVVASGVSISFAIIAAYKFEMIKLGLQ